MLELCGVAAVKAERGSIDIVFANAGAGSPLPLGQITTEHIDKTFDTNVKGTGIRVNVLSPGPTATELAKEALGEEGQKAYGAMTPLQRMADPAEIGAVASFLASSDSSFMTASDVAVDGGLAQL
ncbi:hypothetical protein GCM10027278_08860 [Paralcaligenes ginsengisoli]